MNKSICSFALISCFSLLTGCAGLHRGIPRGERHRRIEPVREATVRQTIVSTEADDALAGTAPSVTVVTEEPVLEENLHPLTDKTAINERRLASRKSDDTLVAKEASPDEAAQIAEALESEEVAHNAYRFSWVPIGWTIFLPLLLVGIIGTAVCLNNFKKYEFVTEKGLEYKRKAMRTLFLSSLLSIAVLIATVAIIILIAILLL